MKGHAFFQGEILTKKQKYLRILKIFLRTSGPISTKLGTKHPWVIGIQVCSKEGPRPFARGDTYEIAGKSWQIFLKSSYPDPLLNFNLSTT